MSEITYEDIYQQILELPQETLIDIAKYIEFVRFKTGKARSKTKHEPPFRPPKVKLGGLLKGYDFSPEFIAKARQEMWGNFPRDIEFDGPIEES